MSNLVNGGTVLLNYRLGDIATRILPGGAPCGLIVCRCCRIPQGRSDDLIELDSGRIVHPQGIRNLFNDEESIWEYQVVQQDAARFSRRAAGRALPRPRGRRAGAWPAKFAAHPRLPVPRVEFVFTESIDRTAGGKFRPVLSRRAGAGRLEAGAGRRRAMSR